MMFSSKPLAERNNDPHPNVWDGHFLADKMRTDTDKFRAGAPHSSPNYSYAPRPAYQHGKLPENPILVDLREIYGTYHKPQGMELGGTAHDWLDLLSDDPDMRRAHNWGDLAGATTAEQRIHAHRVLTLLKTLKKESN